MGQDIKKIENLYDSTAKEYAAKFSGEHERKPKDREILQRFAREMSAKKPVWDFGCGPGQTTGFLKALGLEISGLDLSEKILEQARTNHPGIHFRKGNILKLEFEDDCVAGIVAFYAMVHFTQAQVKIALGEIFRVLRPGGLFLFTFHIGENRIHLDEMFGMKIDIDFMFYSPEFMIKCLEEMGFEKIELIERVPYPVIEFQSQRAYVFAGKPPKGKSP
jgi:ubiquinone/menaquinone biosynthesis C-methylase UbiE